MHENRCQISAPKYISPTKFHDNSLLRELSFDIYWYSLYTVAFALQSLKDGWSCKNCKDRSIIWSLEQIHKQNKYQASEVYCLDFLEKKAQALTILTRDQCLVSSECKYNTALAKIESLTTSITTTVYFCHSRWYSMCFIWRFHSNCSLWLYKKI